MTATSTCLCRVRRVSGLPCVLATLAAASFLASLLLQRRSTAAAGAADDDTDEDAANTNIGVGLPPPPPRPRPADTPPPPLNTKCPHLPALPALPEVWEPLIRDGCGTYKLIRAEGGPGHVGFGPYPTSDPPPLPRQQHATAAEVAASNATAAAAAAAAAAGASPLVCLPPFLRIPGASSGELDLTTAGGRAPPAGVAVSAPSVRWCAPREAWAGCRQCGYSCNNLDAGKGGDRRVRGLRYPLPGHVRAYVSGRQRRTFEDSGEWNVSYMKWQLQGRGGDVAGSEEQREEEKEEEEEEGGSGPTSRRLLSKKFANAPSPFMTLFGGPESAGMAWTAEKMGYRVAFRPPSEYNQKRNHTRCLKTVKGYTFFFSRRFHAREVAGNIGHFIHDNYFPMFAVISRYFDMRVPVDAWRYNVVAFDAKVMKAFDSEWAVGPLAHLVRALFPRRPNLYLHGKCFEKAVFNCAKPNSMEPMAPLQAWLSGAHGFSFAPLRAPLAVSTPPAAGGQAGAAAAAPADALHLLLMLRRPGSARFIGNHAEMAAAAEAAGWNVTVPLRPEDKNGTLQHRMLDTLGYLQRCSLLVGFHGNELATMLFVPMGSVVVEILSGYFRYVDAWYVNQARASGLHLIRWTPANATITYGPRFSSQGDSVFAHTALRHELLFYDRRAKLRTIYEHGARAMRSTFACPMEEWQQVLRLARRLLL